MERHYRIRPLHDSEKVQSGFVEITIAVLKTSREVFSQGAIFRDVRNHIIRLEQRVQTVEQFGIQAMSELANLINTYEHKLVEMQGAINAVAAFAK